MRAAWQADQVTFPQKRRIWQLVEFLDWGRWSDGHGRLRGCLAHLCGALWFETETF